MRLPSRSVLACIPLAYTLVLGGTLHAQCYEQSKLFGSQQKTFDNFGASTATDGTVLVVGVPSDDTAANNAGAVYVYRLVGDAFVEEGHLVASDGAPGDAFGTSVDVDGDRLVVGAPYADPKGAESGAAYVFHFSGGVWTQEVKLTASDAAANDQFGTSVVIQGIEVVAGSPLHGTAITQRGAAYVYEYQGAVIGWQEMQRLEHSNAQPLDRFGSFLRIDGENLAVGIPLAGSTDAGAIQFWKKVPGFWQEDVTLTSLHSDDDRLGTVFDLEGDCLVAGMPLNDANGADAGAIVFFEFQGGAWVEVDFFPSLVSQAFANFGASIALRNDLLYVGSPGSSVLVQDGGLVHAFRRHYGFWWVDPPLGMRAPTSSDRLGSSVQIVGSKVVCASVYDDDKGSDSGALFVYPNSLHLASNKKDYNPGDPMDFTISYGYLSTPAWFASLLVNGVPFFQILTSPTFQSGQIATVSATAPSGLAGVDVTFVAFSLTPWSKAEASNLLTVSFH